MGSRRVYAWETLDGCGLPWDKANERERAQALAMVERYAGDGPHSAPELAESFECREWEIRQARWLAIASGLLARNGRGGFKVTPAGQKGLEHG